MESLGYGSTTTALLFVLASFLGAVVGVFVSMSNASSLILLGAIVVGTLIATTGVWKYVPIVIWISIATLLPRRVDGLFGTNWNVAEFLAWTAVGASLLVQTGVNVERKNRPNGLYIGLVGLVLMTGGMHLVKLLGGVQDIALILGSLSSFLIGPIVGLCTARYVLEASRLHRWLVLGVSVSVGLGLLGVFLGETLLRTVGIIDLKHAANGSDIIRLVSTLGGPNTVAQVAALVLPLTMVQRLFRGTATRSVLFVIVALGLIMTSSRTGLIAAAAGFCFLALVLPTRLKLASMAATVTVTFALSHFIANSRLAAVLKPTELLSDPGAARPRIWETALDLVARSPLSGWVPDSLLDPQFSSSVGLEGSFHAHNLYMQNLVNNGILVGSLWNTWFICLVCQAVRYALRYRDPYLLAVAAGLVSLSVASIGDYILWDVRPSLAVWIFLGAVMRLFGSEPVERVPLESESRDHSR